MYRALEAGEIIKEGDQVDAAAGWNDSPIWVATSLAGEPAPDPTYPAHCRYRRIIAVDEGRETIWD
jgi:hypothetical protein